MTPVLRSASRFRTFVAILASVCLIALPGYAQMNSATLVGTVVDQGGALIVGANVVVRNTATNLSRSDTTTADGLFRIPDLPAGNYEVRVERAGFKTTVHSGVVLHVGETSRVDVSMQVGVVEQQVQVSSGSVLVNTEEARVTHIVEEKQLEELPLVRRNIYQLPVLEPGTQPTRVQIPTYYNNSVYELGFTTYGKRIRSTNFLLDSAPNTDNGLGGVPAIAPILDAVQEFQVSTNTFGREYGRNFGAVINVATKSGTNGLHGSIWQFHRNAAMNASNFFDPGKPSALIHNQFGFTLGGPLRKDHTFWFLAYEGFREKRGTTRKIETETPEMRDWVHTNRPGSVADYLFQNFPGPAVDPATKTDIGAPGLPSDGPFGFDPTPDGIPDLALGVGQAINSTTTDQFNVRLDHVFRESDKVFFRYSGHYPRTIGVGELTTIGRLGRILRGFRRPLDGSLGNLAVGYTHMVSQNLLNDFRFGFLRNQASTGASPDNVPNIVSDDFLVGFGSDFFLPLEFTNREFNFRDTVVYSHGKHGVKLGLEYNHDVENGFFDAVSRGFYEFANILDFANDLPYLQLQHLDPVTGQSIISSPNHIRNFRRRDWAWFAQDDWKVRRNLTLNLGLRWEYFGVVQETSGKQAGITLGSGSDFQTQFVNSTLGPLKQMYNPYHKNFAPAVGVAWDPFSNGKFSVRAGWAMNFDRIHNDLLTEPARFTPPFGAFAVAVPILGVGGPIPYTVSDVINLPPTPNPLCGGLNSSGALANCLVFPYLIDKNLKTPYVEEWNLTLQYEFAPDWVLDVGYAGNSAHRLAFTNDPNRVTGGFVEPACIPLPTGCFGNRPNHNLAWVSYLSTSQGSNYNGLTLQVKKRFTHGYLLQGSYTFGKVLDIQDDAFAGDFINAGTGYFGTNDVNNIRGDYGRSSFDIRHRITGNVVWDIGAFKNRSSAFQALLGGWQVNVIGSYESGRPFTVFNSVTDYNGDGGGGTQGGAYDRPDIPSFGNSIGCPGPDKFVAGIFQPTDFPVPAPGVSGNLGRNTYCGPNYKAVDFSLVKNITAHFLGEGGHIQFRAEAFNVFNRVNLYLPDSDLGAGSLTIGNPLFSTFGKSTQAFSPRELQLGLKISW